VKQKHKRYKDIIDHHHKIDTCQHIIVGLWNKCWMKRK
jgi:hypothetical protein